MKKTKELVIDFRRKRPVHTPLYIMDTAVGDRRHIKFLGVCIANNLTWSLHTSSTVKKVHQRLHFLQRLKRAHLSPSIFTTYYIGTTESVLISSISLWHESSSASDRKALGRVVRSAKKIIGVALPPVGDLAKQFCLSKATTITRDLTHLSWTLFLSYPQAEDAAACHAEREVPEQLLPICHQTFEHLQITSD